MYATATAPDQRPRNPNRLPNADDFPYGKVICPARDRIGGVHDERNREQLCVDDGIIKQIEQLSAKNHLRPVAHGQMGSPAAEDRRYSGGNYQVRVPHCPQG